MAPSITYDQSGEQIRELWDRADVAHKASDGEAELDAYWAVLGHSCAHHQVVAYEVLDQIHHALRGLGRYDEAIQAKREAIMAREQSMLVQSISPLNVHELVEAKGDRAGTGESRACMAAEMARAGRAIAWPPARNQTCWCGSGRKYKRCCGPVPPHEVDGP